jgi:flagellar assembly factor FliW
MAKTRHERIIQSRVGRIEVDDRRVLYFPKGLIGFPEQKEFTLIQMQEKSPFLVLQNIYDARLGLLVADPFSFVDDYEVKLGAAEQKILGLESIRQVAVLVTVNIPKDRPDMTALNLNGPILINYKARVGLQVPQVEGKHPSRFYIHRAAAK